MSIWDEPLTKEEYLRRLFEAKAEQRKKDAELLFDEKVEIVLDLQDASRALRAAAAVVRGDDGQPYAARPVRRGIDGGTDDSQIPGGRDDRTH